MVPHDVGARGSVSKFGQGLRGCELVCGPEVSCALLRHVAATLLLGAGADLKVVQELLGHSSITITADIYASVLPELAFAQAEAAAALVPRARSPKDAQSAPAPGADSPSAHASLTQTA